MSLWAAAAGTEAATGGLLELGFRLAPGGRTALDRRRQRFPLHCTAPLYLDPALPGMPFVYVQNPTGGVFAGDRLCVRVEAGPGTRVHLTTAAATKVYRMETAHAQQLTELTLGAGSYVELVPEPLIPQAGSHLVSRVAATLAEGAALVAVETTAPGRLARGEVFGYQLLELCTEVRDEAGRELCVDRLRFEPGRRSPGARGLLGAASYLGTLLVVAPGRDGERLAAHTDAALAELAGVRAAAGPLPGGAGSIARVLGDSAGAVRTAIETAWAEARGQLLGVPLAPRRR
jgi:urease accessory protein